MKEEIILKGVKNEQGFYEIRIPKEIKIYSYGGNGDYDYIKCIKKEEILDDTEKEYLSAVIKPFRDRVRFIKKIGGYTTRQYITIVLKDESIEMPYFKTNSMYKGMEQNKEYTLEELGL